MLSNVLAKISYLIKILYQILNILIISFAKLLKFLDNILITFCSILQASQTLRLLSYSDLSIPTPIHMRLYCSFLLYINLYSIARQTCLLVSHLFLLVFDDPKVQYYSIPSD